MGPHFVRILFVHTIIQNNFFEYQVQTRFFLVFFLLSYEMWLYEL